MSDETKRPKAQKLPSGNYRIQVRDPLDPSKKISIVEPTESLCIARAERYRNMRGDLRHGGLQIGDALQKREQLRNGRAMTAREVWQEYVATFPEARVRAIAGQWDRHFAHHFDRAACFELTAAKMGAWEKWMGTRKVERMSGKQKPLGAQTIKTVFALLRSAYNRQVKQKRMAEVPWGEWRPSGHFGAPAQEREALRSADEVAALLHVAAAHDERLRAWGTFSDLWARLVVLIFCGLRQGELGGLGWDDLRTVGGLVTLWVRHQVRAGWKKDHPEWERPLDVPKRGSKGMMRVHAVCVAALETHRIYLLSKDSYRPNGPIFPKPGTSEWRTDETVVKPERIRELVRETGLPIDVDRFVTHSTRHTFATLEALGSGDLASTAARTRHADPKQLMQYMHRAGRGLPAPAIPHIETRAPSAATVEDMPAPVDLLALTSERATELEDDKRDAAALATLLRPLGPSFDGAAADEVSPMEAADAGASDLERWWRRWVEGGRKTVRPKEVTEQAQAAYTRAWVAATRAGRGAAAAKACGMRAKNAYLGAWGRMARRLGEAPERTGGPKGLRRAEPRDDATGAEVIPLFGPAR